MQPHASRVSGSVPVAQQACKVIGRGNGRVQVIGSLDAHALLKSR
jgi:ribosomal protein L36